MTAATTPGHRVTEPGQYFVMPGGGVAGWVVRHGQPSEYGHAGLVMPDGKTMEARGGGVQQRDLAQVIRDGAVFCDEPLEPLFRRDVVLWALSMRGHPYDNRVNIDIALNLLVGLRSPFLPVGKDGAFNCSQLVAVGYTACGKVMFPKIDRWQISPGMLANRITTRPWLD